MLEFNFLRVNMECVKEGFRVCNFLDEVLFIVDDIINFDDCCKVIQIELDSLLVECNMFFREIGEFFKLGQKDEVE